MNRAQFLSLSRPAYALAEREVVRFLRQPARVVGALAAPILFWIFLGSGLNRSFALPGAEQAVGYLRFAYTGTLLMMVLFTSIFSSISVIQDRTEGFLQSVLVSPASRSGIAVGKILGASALACIQGALFLFLAPLAGVPLGPVNVILCLLVMFLVSVGLAGLGFILAWRTDSVQGFHAIMNLVLFPMWLLSGSLFPISGASRWLGWLMRLNPLTYGVTAVRSVLDPGSISPGIGVLPAFVVSILFAILMIYLATLVVAAVPRGGRGVAGASA